MKTNLASLGLLLAVSLASANTAPTPVIGSAMRSVEREASSIVCQAAQTPGSHRILPDVRVRIGEGGKGIPFNQLGAEAQKQYVGTGISVTPIAGAAKLRAIMQRLEGEATGEGLWLTSIANEDAGRENRFRVRAVGFGRTGTIWSLSPTGMVRANADTAIWIRPGLTEEYTVSTDGVRQDFVLPERPAGGGELVVDLEVSCAWARTAAYGATLAVATTGRELAYHRLRVSDATGRELVARLEVLAADHLSVVVEDVGALYPLRIDPTFSDADWVSVNTGIPGANGTVETIVADGIGNLYVGGSFTAIGTVSANYIAKWNGSVWVALGSGMNGNCSELAIVGGDLYAGGDFAAAGDVANTRYLARWNGSAWSALGSGVNNVVSSLAASGGDLYVGGSFTTAGGVANTRCIAKWNGSAWSALGSGMDAYVAALVVSGTDLYAGGVFTTAGGVYARYIGKWNGSAWSALGSGMEGPSPYVAALAVNGADLYVGGQFTTAGGVSAANIAKWNGSAWFAMGSGTNGGVYALAVSGGDVYAGGQFSTAGGLSAMNIAKWNGSAWSAVGSGMDGGVRALVVSGSELYAGGAFSTADGMPASSIARWNSSL